MSVVDKRLLKPADYDSLVSHMERFFFGVTFMNERIINDAIKTVNDFLDTLQPEAPQEEAPQEEPTVPGDEEPLFDPTDFEAIKKYTELLESLTRSDFDKGGHRHRNYRGTLMHWDTRYKWSVTDTAIHKFKWRNSSSSWLDDGTITGTLNVVSEANKFKNAIGSQLTMQFPVTSHATLFYFIFTYPTGH